MKYIIGFDGVLNMGTIYLIDLVRGYRCEVIWFMSFIKFKSIDYTVV